MIQRVQSLFFFFSSVTLLSIVFYFPVLVSITEDLNGLQVPELAIGQVYPLGLSFFSIFQFKNRKRQIIISSLARLMITIAFILLVFIYKKQLAFGIGLFLLIIPYTTLFLATYFIRKDDRLIKDADRIR